MSIKDLAELGLSNESVIGLMSKFTPKEDVESVSGLTSSYWRIV